MQSASFRGKSWLQNKDPHQQVGHMIKTGARLKIWIPIREGEQARRKVLGVDGQRLQEEDSAAVGCYRQPSKVPGSRNASVSCRCPGLKVAAP